MRFTTLVSRSVAAATLIVNVVNAIQVDFTDPASVKSAASTLAYDMMTYYTGNISGDNNVPGLLAPPPDGYYWWEAGAMFNALIDYWQYTGDATYNSVVSQALLFQVGANHDYQPQNQTRGLGNDDQSFWGMAALTAAEQNFPNPPAGQPQWLALAQAVWNTQVAVWDTSTCAGGLRWQKFTFNNGYDYKNSISNGCFFSIGARLARYTGNSTYTAWADKTWDWLERIGLIDENYSVFDGSDDNLNCTQINRVQYSYNAGIILIGAATMWNVTGEDKWRNRTLGIIQGIDATFLDPTTKAMVEISCETQTPPTCNTDMKSFKAYLSRWMGLTTKMAPFTYPIIAPLLLKSAQAAVAQCTGGPTGRQCGLRWAWEGKQAVWDGTTGVGQEMAALEVVLSTIVNTAPGPLTNVTGGTSVGDYSAGTQGLNQNPYIDNTPVTAGDRAGAGILTTVVLLVAVGGMGWMSLE